jgi:hypothetical protein
MQGAWLGSATALQGSGEHRLGRVMLSKGRQGEGKATVDLLM